MNKVGMYPPEGNPEEKLFLPELYWWYNILILVRGIGIPMYFLFLPSRGG